MYFPSVNIRASAKLWVSSFSCLVTATGVTMRPHPVRCGNPQPSEGRGAPVCSQVVMGRRHRASHCPLLPPLPPWCAKWLVRSVRIHREAEGSRTGLGERGNILSLASERAHSLIVPGFYLQFLCFASLRDNFPHLGGDRKTGVGLK